MNELPKIHNAKGAGRPKGSPNQNSLTVRRGFNRMGFDAIEEWVKAYRKCDDVATQLQSLEIVMKYIYPKLKEIEMTPDDILALEAEEFMTIKPADMPTEMLLEQLKDEKK